jgi:hypothetical protein
MFISENWTMTLKLEKQREMAIEKFARSQASLEVC